MPHRNRKSKIGIRQSLNPSSQRSPNLPLPRVVDAATLAEIDAALAAGERPGALFARLELAKRFDIRFDQLRYYHRKRRKTAPDSPLSPDSPPAIAGARSLTQPAAHPFTRRAARRNVRQLRDLLTDMDHEFAGVEACDIHHRAQLLAAAAVAAVLARDAATLPMTTIIQAARALTDLWSGVKNIPFLERLKSALTNASPEVQEACIHDYVASICPWYRPPPDPTQPKPGQPTAPDESPAPATPPAPSTESGLRRRIGQDDPAGGSGSP